MIARGRRWLDGMGATVIALALWASAAPAQASPQDLFGYGGRTPGLGMTGTSYAEGAEAVFANPAGLGAGRRRELTVGFTGGGYQLEIDGERDPLTPARGMVIGFSLPLPFGDVLEDRLVFGGAFYTPAEVLLRGRVRFPTVPQWGVLDRAQVLSVMAGLGFDFHGIVDGLQIGIALSALANVYGELFVELDETNAFSSVVETQLITTFAPIVGARYVQDEWGVGLTYRHELTSSMDLNIVTMDLPVELPVLTVGGIVQYDPPTLVAEGYWKPIPDLMLVANVTTRFWNFYPGVQIPTTSMGLNAPDPEFSARPSPRVAAEGTWHHGMFTFALRGGYAFEPTPAPSARVAPRRTASGDPIDQTVPFRLLDSHRHVLTLGGGWTIHLGDDGERLVLDVFGQAHLLQNRTHVIGRTDGAPPMETGGYVLTGGWTLRAEF
ncbi:MAG TPA: hypothetical protein RMH99_22585 [Sandaracinaceae bacterium LLY-WYZ-13_1]|nr:hypothetical protein [Sandaracinaceae bacterium LLY-WYZ-13_1]